MGQISSAKCLHGEHTFPRRVAQPDGLHHFLFGCKLIALSDPKSCAVDQGEHHVQSFHGCRSTGDVHVMGGKADGPDKPLLFGIPQRLPRTAALLQLAGAHLVHQKNIDHITIQRFPCLRNSLHHPLIFAGQGLGADDHVVKLVILQCFADVGIGPVILGGINKVDPLPEGIANDFRAFLHRQSQLARPDGQHAESNGTDLNSGISQPFLFHRRSLFRVLWAHYTTE